MKLRRFYFVAAASLLIGTGSFSVTAQVATDVASAPVYVPDMTHAGEPLPDGVIAWDETIKATDAAFDQDFAKFTFSFTNVATNVIAILTVHPSCGCTTADIPPTPWIIPAGSNGQIKVSVNLAGKAGTLFKSLTVTTDHGRKDLMLRINMQSAPPPKAMTEDEKAKGIAAAKIDRQAVFKGECATCHINKIQGKYGQQLYDAVCGICHEAEHRASMVPNLHTLNLPTNEEFWRTWITYGKPGSLMPAFAQSQEGPLNDLQIASLAQYLHAMIPPNVTNAPAAK
jgi:mono/diheme cytochrome c family protein